MAESSRVWVLRNDRVESVHRISAAVVDGSGDLAFSTGDPQLRTYFRSSAKLLQAIPFIESAGDEVFGLTPGEVAVIASSHNGEKMHTDAVYSILSKIGLKEEDLFCGPHEPINPAAAEALRAAGRKPTSVHNNCSGKHAGILALCVLNGWPVKGYQLAGHRAQERIFGVIAEATDQRVSSIEYGTDGCGIPTFYLSITQMALAYSRLMAWAKQGGERGRAVEKIIGAIREEPLMLDGTGGFSTDLAKATSGRIIGKVGAEGLFCIGVPREGLGIAIKVEDGNRRATSAAAVETLKALGLLAEGELESLSRHHRPVIANHQGAIVGNLSPEIHFKG